MRFLSLSLLCTALVGAQTLRGVLGLFEGNGTTYPNSGLFYYLEAPNGSSQASAGHLPDVEPFGNDLAYDPRTQLLFVIGGSRSAFAPWRGSVYALDVWRSLVPLPTRLDSIGARRLAVRDTLLLVTRSRAPYFTAYRIRYNAQTGTLQLDSLWSPTSPLLRNVPDGLLVWGDTAYVALSYNPTTYAADSLVLAIDLRSRAVVASWEVFRNPTEIARIGNALYAACYGDFSGNLRIARITPNSPTPTIWDVGRQSFGGFAADRVTVKDTLLFWEALTDTLRAFSITSQQVAPGAYGGMASSGGGLSGYGLLWAGPWLWVSYTNYTDTSLIILRDAAPLGGGPVPRVDTMFVSNGLGGIGYPSLRRFVYFEGDTSRTTTALSLAQGQPFSVWPNPATEWLSWSSAAPVEGFTLWSADGRKLREWIAPKFPLYVADLPVGAYFLQVRFLDGRTQVVRVLRAGSGS